MATRAKNIATAKPRNRFISDLQKEPNAESVLEAVTDRNPIRDGYRTAAKPGKPDIPGVEPPGPAALPCKRCGSEKD
jgi:hypothetical protein